MIDKFKSIFVIPELRQRIFFTIGVLVIVRIGAHIPIAGVNGEILVPKELTENMNILKDIPG